MGVTRRLGEYNLCKASKQPPNSCVGTLYTGIYDEIDMRYMRRKVAHKQWWIIIIIFWLVEKATCQSGSFQLNE